MELWFILLANDIKIKIRVVGGLIALEWVSDSRSVISDSLQAQGLYILPSSSVPGILQARLLEGVAISFSRGSSQPRNQTPVSCIESRFFTSWATREPLQLECSINRFFKFTEQGNIYMYTKPYMYTYL